MVWVSVRSMPSLNGVRWKSHLDGKIHCQRYKRGCRKVPVKEIGKVKADDTGTKDTFKFDKQIFTEDN